MKNNTFFEEMKKAGYAYEDERTERKKIKDAILAAKDIDEEALKAWYAEEEKHPFPFSKGQMTAYYSWANSLMRNTDAFEVNDLPWEKDTPDFIKALKAAGISHIVVTDRSTALMEGIHLLMELGCTMTGLETVTRREERWGDEEATKMPGIGFDIA